MMSKLKKAIVDNYAYDTAAGLGWLGFVSGFIISNSLKGTTISFVFFFTIFCWALGLIIQFSINTYLSIRRWRKRRAKKKQIIRVSANDQEYCENCHKAL